MTRTPRPLPFESSFSEAAKEHFRTKAWADGVPGANDAVEVIFPTVLHALADGARRNPRLGITLIPEEAGETDEHRPYAQLLEEIRGLAQYLAAEGIERGDRVLLVLPTSYDFIIAFLACQMAGAVPVPGYPPAALAHARPALDRLAFIAEHAETRICIADDRVKLLLGEVSHRASSLRRIYGASELRGARGPDAELEARPDELAVIQYTSGSTGNPKGVALTHENLVANIHVVGQALQVNRQDSTVTWLPLYHDMGLIGGMLMPIYWRLPMVLMSPMTFIKRPEAWLWAFHNYRGTLTAAPNFAYARCVKRVRDSDCEGLDLSCVRLCLNGAEPVNVETIRAFEEKFSPHGFRPEAMYPVYGLAESSVAVTFPVPGERPRHEILDRAKLLDGEAMVTNADDGVSVAAVGRAMPGHKVMIVDDSGRELPDRAIGQIVVRGPSVMRGYFRDRLSTRNVLLGGWLWTGDLGYMVDGELFVTGRVKDLIIIRGRNHYAEDIEQVAESVDGVRAGGVVAFALYDDDHARDRTVIVCETRLQEGPQREALVEAVSSAVREACELNVDEVVLVEPGTIPKTPSGKRQRNLTKRRYEEKDLKPSEMNNVAILSLLTRSAIGHARASFRRLVGRE